MQVSEKRREAIKRYRNAPPGQRLNRWQRLRAATAEQLQQEMKRD